MQVPLLASPLAGCVEPWGKILPSPGFGFLERSDNHFRPCSNIPTASSNNRISFSCKDSQPCGLTLVEVELTLFPLATSPLTTWVVLAEHTLLLAPTSVTEICSGMDT